MTICGQCGDTGRLRLQDENGLIHTESCDWCRGKSPLQAEIKWLRDCILEAVLCLEAPFAPPSITPERRIQAALESLVAALGEGEEKG